MLFATPIDLPRLMPIHKPALRVTYEYADHGEPDLETLLLGHLEPMWDRAPGECTP